MDECMITQFKNNFPVEYNKQIKSGRPLHMDWFAVPLAQAVMSGLSINTT